MTSFDKETSYFIALTTFERGDSESKILPPTAQGAVGWIGVRFVSEEGILPAIDQELSEVGLRLVEIGRVIEVRSSDDVATHDEHLAANMEAWQEGRLTAWGTIHTYMAEGSA